MRRVTLTLAAALMTGVLSLMAQGPPRARERPLDAAAVVFDLANAMGMLRSLQQQDSVITLEQWGSGTMTVGAEKFAVPEHRTSINYTVPGMRVDFMRNGPNGQKVRQIQVVSGAHAWDEADRGVQPTATPQAVKQRLVELWTTPMGAVKAASAAGAAAKLAVESADSYVLTFALPAPANDVTATITARKDAKLMVTAHPNALEDLVGTYIVKITTTGAVVSETIYADYGDWNWDDYKADVFLPKSMIRRTGNLTMEIVTKNTNTYNPYVVMPVPKEVKGTVASGRLGEASLPWGR